jgi:hypothetical protein
MYSGNPALFDTPYCKFYLQQSRGVIFRSWKITNDLDELLTGIEIAFTTTAQSLFSRLSEHKRNFDLNL